MLVHTFIKGSEPNTKILLNFALGGQALEKTYDELYAVLNRIAKVTLSVMGDLVD